MTFTCAEPVGPAPERGVIGVFAYRCSDGHVFRLSLVRRLLSLHLGWSKYGRCPVDGHWRLFRLVDPKRLTPAQFDSFSGSRGR